MTFFFVIVSGSATHLLYGRARVHELMDYGAVLEMAVSGARHLLPISEVSHTKMRDIRDILREGQVGVNRGTYSRNCSS